MTQVQTQDTLLTFKEAMQILKVSRSTLYRLMWAGQLTGHKIGSTWRFYWADLQVCIGEPEPVECPACFKPYVRSTK